MQWWQAQVGPNHNAINQVFASHALHCWVEHAVGGAAQSDVWECVKHFVLRVLPSLSREQVRDWGGRDHPGLILTVGNIPALFMKIFHLLAIFFDWAITPSLHHCGKTPQIGKLWKLYIERVWICDGGCVGGEGRGEHKRVCYGDQIREEVMGLKRWGRALSLTWDTAADDPGGRDMRRELSRYEAGRVDGRAQVEPRVPWWRWRGLVHPSLIRPPRPPQAPCKNGVLSIIKTRRADAEPQIFIWNKDVWGCEYIPKSYVSNVELHELLLVALELHLRSTVTIVTLWCGGVRLMSEDAWCFMLK